MAGQGRQRPRRARPCSTSASGSPAPSRAPTAATSSTATCAPRTSASTCTASPRSPTSASPWSPGTGPTGPPTVARLAHAAPEQLQNHVPRRPPTSTASVRCCTRCSPAARRSSAPATRRSPASAPASSPRTRADLRPHRRPRARRRRHRAGHAEGPGRPVVERRGFGLALQQAEVTLGLPITPMVVIGPDRVIARPVVEQEEAPAAGAGAGEEVVAHRPAHRRALRPGRRRCVGRASSLLGGGRRRGRRRRAHARHPGRGAPTSTSRT